MYSRWVMGVTAHGRTTDGYQRPGRHALFSRGSWSHRYWSSSGGMGVGSRAEWAHDMMAFVCAALDGRGGALLRAPGLTGKKFEQDLRLIFARELVRWAFGMLC
jgi:hypothetical protein